MIYNIYHTTLVTIENFLLRDKSFDITSSFLIKKKHVWKYKLVKKIYRSGEYWINNSIYYWVVMVLILLDIWEYITTYCMG